MSLSVSSGLSSQAAPIEIEWNGNTVSLRELEWSAVISKLESFLIDRSLRIKMISWKTQMEAGLLGIQQVSELADRFADDCIENGTYSFGRPVMMKILGMADAGKSPSGSKQGDPVLMEGYMKLVALMTGLNENDAVSLMATKGSELSMKLGLALKRGMPSNPKHNGAAPSQPPMASLIPEATA